MNRQRMIQLLLLGVIGMFACGQSSERVDDKKLTVWAMGEEGKKIAIMARKFETENPGIKVVTQAIPWSAADQKIFTAVVGKIPPDVSQMGTTWMAKYATLEALEPLTPYIERSQVVQKQNFMEGSWNTGIVNDEVYGIPWYVDTRVIFYRKDLLKEVGFDQPPQTWEELKSLCQKLKRAPGPDGKGKRYGISLPVKDWQVFLPFVWQNGGDILNPTAPEFQESVEFFLSFFEEGLSPSDAVDVDPYKAFSSGLYPMFVSGPWMVELLKSELPDLTGQWGVAVLPKKKSRTSFVGGSNLVIFQRSQKKELAWKFVEFMSRPETQLEWYGVMNSLPATKEAWQDPTLKGHAMLKVFGEQLKDTKSPPAIPEWEEIANALNKEMEILIIRRGKKGNSVQESMARLEKKIQSVLSRTPKNGSMGRVVKETPVKTEG